MGMPKKKGKAGTATAFVSRGKAIKKLQLSLKDFRRLCILKGIYPVEPRNKTKAGGHNKTYYMAKDIRFLAHEPIINKFREMKSFAKKLRRAIDKNLPEKEKALRNNEPTYKLDHIVKERYPTFIDAVRDLDDALSMCFLFARLPKSGLYKAEQLQLCKRLTVEFMNYVIESRSLVKCFISIKGFYYRAIIQGQPITWVVPHSFPHNGEEVDARIMSTFTDFYVTLLGFVNFKLYTSINLVYPPKLAIESINPRDLELCEGDDPRDEYLESLTTSLKSVVKDIEDEVTIDEFNDADAVGVKESAAADKSFRNLFAGLKVFLNREVPREPFTFVLRSFGAQVSWDSTTFPGATFDEKDSSITHQIVDRPTVANKFLNRSYVQPQWVFDCINAKRLLPVNNYFNGVELPPHLSPFVENTEGSYVPLTSEEMKERVENDQEMEVEPTSKKRKVNSEETKAKDEMKVQKGKVFKKDASKIADRITAEEKKLAVMMIPKKDKRLFDKIHKKKRIERREVNKLIEKRETIIKGKKKALKS